jgi:predicted metalloendopeptidase
MRARRKPDDKSPDVNVIAVGSGEAGLPSKKYYDDKKTVANYTRAMAQMFQVVWTGVPVTAENLYKEAENYSATARNIAEFEKKLANASPDPEIASEPEVSLNYSRIFC